MACRTTADVAVDFSEDGSGTVDVSVALDAEAAAAIGGAEELVLTDLDGTGWEISGPEVADDGALSLSASHEFSDVSQLASVLDTVAGPGVFTGLEFDIEEPFGSTNWAAGMEVAVSGDPAQFSDEALTELLGGLPLGRTPEELAGIGATAPGAATMTVQMSMFGEDTDSAELDLTAGQPSSASLVVEHNETQVLVFVLAAAAVLLAVASGVFAVLSWRNRR